MSNVSKLDTPKTPLDKAKEELEAEMNNKAVKLLKEKLAEKRKAELVLKNIEREIEDLVDRVGQGDV